VSDWYRHLGVSAHKTFLKDVEQERGDFFAKVLPDLAGDGAYRFALHADGVGTKGVLAYLWWKETGDISVWEGLAQDALIMNTDDLACMGAVEGFVFSTVITRNALRISDEVVQRVIRGVHQTVAWLNEIGIRAEIGGGETADMTDVVRTIGLEAVAAVRLPEKSLIPFRRPEKCILIVGLASYGQATYEKFPNSGIGCNGLTAARHLLLSATYEQKYPETIEPHLPQPYRGSYTLTSLVEGESLGRLLLSPTRTYLPILRDIYRTHREAIYGVVHCTGGGQRKALKYFPGTYIRKEQFLPLPPVFALLRGQRTWRELFEVFNMGHRMEIYVEPSVAQEVIAISKEYGVAAQVIGEALPAEKTRMEVSFEGEEWEWRLD
jgi:phosphoribosylformylglycinamidine cyclo-ligase